MIQYTYTVISMGMYMVRMMKISVAAIVSTNNTDTWSYIDS